MKQSIRPFENIFSVFALLLFSNGFYPIILGSNVGEGDIDSPMLRIVFMAIYFVTCGLLLFRWQRTIHFLTTNYWLLLLIGLAIVSISWSSVPAISFRKVIALIGSTLFAIYLGSRYNFKEQLNIYCWTFGIGLFFSYLFGLALPQYGVMNTDAIVGAWNGIFPHKNGLGESMFIGFMAFYFSSQVNRKNRTFYRVLCFLAVIIVYLAQSATALMSVLYIFAMAESLKRLSLKSKKSVLIILLFLMSVSLALFLLLMNFELFLSANGRDITLSGRTSLWDTLWQFITEKPWLGYGYGSFFSGQSREANLLWQAHDWSPVHAHNGYIQFWLNLGLVGLLIFLVGYFSCLFKSLYKYLSTKEIRLLWIFLFLIYTIVQNLTEVSFFSGSNSWIVTLAGIYSMQMKTGKIARTRTKTRLVAPTN